MRVRLASLAIAMMLFGIAAIGCVAGSPAATQTPAPAPTAAPPAATASAPVVLKLEGPGGAKTLTMDDLKALPAIEGWAGIKSSTGKITVPERFKGVALDELCKLVGGLRANTGVSIVAKDGYAMTISYDQITKGDFITYDPGTGDEIKTQGSAQGHHRLRKRGQAAPGR